MSTPFTSAVVCDCANDDHDRPEVALARAMSLAREVAERLRGDCAHALDDRARGVATTVARAADERTIWQDRVVGPLIGLAEQLDRLITASIGPVACTEIVGEDEDGPIRREAIRDMPDPRLVALRDDVVRLSAALDAVADMVAADAAVAQMRQAAS